MSFRAPRSLPILSIFHNPSSSESVSALQLLQAKRKRPTGEEIYNIDVLDNVNAAPTPSQLQQVAEYLGTPQSHWKTMLSSENMDQHENKDVHQMIIDQPQLLKRPLVVDWNQGRAAVGSSTLQAIKELIDARVKK
ncbi:hypothetical protein BDF14DRAFT_1789179 [Spinellus fusiger]|nr:hypothetical protein BDF14DRAFT_1789179 [Spinellus fusiger]